jgi:sugar lactone lactonase YvrE
MRMELLCDAQCKIGESPVFTEGGALYWLDIQERQLHRWVAGQHDTMALPCTVGAIAPAEAGLIAAGGKGFGLIAAGDSATTFQPLADVLPADVQIRMNDGALDRQGRFWAGSMSHSVEPSRPEGQLFRFDGQADLAPLPPLLVQNGLAFSPDGRTMYLSDSHKDIATVWRFDYDRQSGTPTNRAVFCSSADLGGRPDGAAMDTDGCYWIAASDGGRIVRLTPEGRIDAVVEVPTRNPTNICFGGPDLRTIFVTSLISSQPDQFSGGVFALESPWQGLPETPWRPAPRGG